MIHLHAELVCDAQTRFGIIFRMKRNVTVQWRQNVVLSWLTVHSATSWQWRSIMLLTMS